MLGSSRQAWLTSGAQDKHREMNSISEPSSPKQELAIRRRIARAIRRARLALLWEELWPRLMPSLLVAGLFLLVSWLGLWSGLADWLRFTLLGVFALAASASLLPLLWLRTADTTAAFTRVERVSGWSHRPATAILDHLAAEQADAQTAAIWQAHRARLLTNFGSLRAGLPSPGVARRDPYGLRFLVLLLLVVAFIATGGNAAGRVADAFRGAVAGVSDVAAIRIDAWAAPPDYTGRPSIFLTSEFALFDDGPISVPENTEIFVRLAGAGADELRVIRSSTYGDAEPLVEQQRLDQGPRDFRVTLREDVRIAIDGAGGERIAWSFSVVADNPPSVVFSDGPAEANAGGLQIGYILKDDYGVTAAWAEIALATPDDMARPLVGAPEFRLTVPRTEAPAADAVTIRDLSQHPWAGLDADFTLIAEDAAGQRGTSAARRATMPSRSFLNPIAQALIEQRQILALDAGQAGEVAAAIDRLAIAPETSPSDFGTFLVLRSAFYRLALADGDDQLRAVIDYLWDIAISIEGNPLADAATALEAATDALREAIQRNADENEIAALTERLRQAIQDYMQTLANTAQQPTETARDGETRVLTPDQLQDMLDRLQALAEAGDLAAAEQLLNQLQQTMRNLEVGALDGLERDAQLGAEALDELGALTRQQQQLMDRTFGLQQQQNAPFPFPQNNEEAGRLGEQLQQQRAAQEAEAAELEQRQRQLQAELQRLMEEFAANGLDPGELPDADRNMAEAANRLDEARPGLAVDRQAEAIAQMRGVAEAPAERLGEAQQLNGPQLNELGGGQDPLGRPRHIDGQLVGDAVEVPDEIDRQLAREIVDMIRQRLGDPDRPLDERNYLERLLDLR